MPAKIRILKIGLFCLCNLLAMNVFASSGDPAWSASNASANNQYDSLISSQNGTIYTAGLMSTVFMSTDGCQTWSPVTTEGLPGTIIATLGMDAKNTLYASSLTVHLLSIHADVFKLANGNKTWVEAAAGFPQSAPAVTFLILPNGEMYAGTAKAGALKLSQGSNTWVAENNGLPKLDKIVVSSIIMDQKGSLYMTAIAPQTPQIYTLTAGSHTWIPLTNGLAADLTVFSLMSDSNGNIFAATNTGVYKLAQGTQLWVAANQGLINLKVSNFFKDNTGSLYVGTPSGVFMLPSGANAWILLDSKGLPTNDPKFEIMALAKNPNGKLCVATKNNGVFVQN